MGNARPGSIGQNVNPGSRETHIRLRFDSGLRQNHDVSEMTEFQYLMSQRLMPFGKHKGKAFDEVPLDYLEWVAKNSFVKEVSNRCRREIARRHSPHADRDPVTHYRWTHPVSGDAHWLPKDVDISEREACPFGDIDDEFMFENELDREYRDIVA